MPDVKETTKPKTTEVKKVRIPKPSTPVVLSYVFGVITGVTLTLGVQALFGNGASVTIDNPEPSAS